MASLVDLHLVDPLRGERSGAVFGMPSSIRVFVTTSCAARASTTRQRTTTSGSAAGRPGEAAAGIDVGRRAAVAGNAPTRPSGSRGRGSRSPSTQVEVSSSSSSQWGLAPLWDMHGHPGRARHARLRARGGSAMRRHAGVRQRGPSWSAGLGLRQRANVDRSELLDRMARGEQIARDLGDGNQRCCARRLRPGCSAMPYTGDGGAAAASEEALELAVRLGDERWLGAIEAWSACSLSSRATTIAPAALGRSAVRRALGVW